MGALAICFEFYLFYEVCAIPLFIRDYTMGASGGMLRLIANRYKIRESLYLLLVPLLESPACAHHSRTSNAEPHAV